MVVNRIKLEELMIYVNKNFKYFFIDGLKVC